MGALRTAMPRRQLAESGRKSTLSKRLGRSHANRAPRVDFCASRLSNPCPCRGHPRCPSGYPATPGQKSWFCRMKHQLVFSRGGNPSGWGSKTQPRPWLGRLQRPNMFFTPRRVRVSAGDLIEVDAAGADAVNEAVALDADVTFWMLRRCRVFSGRLLPAPRPR